MAQSKEEKNRKRRIRYANNPELRARHQEYKRNRYRYNEEHRLLTLQKERERYANSAIVRAKAAAKNAKWRAEAKKKLGLPEYRRRQKAIYDRFIAKKKAEGTYEHFLAQNKKRLRERKVQRILREIAEEEALDGLADVS